MNISQIYLLVILNSSPPAILPILEGGNSTFPAAQDKTLEPSLTSVLHTPHPIFYQILSFLSTKHIKNPTTSLYLHCHHLGPNPQCLFSGFLKQLSCPWAPLISSQISQRIPIKTKSVHNKHVPKTFQWLPFSLRKSQSPYCGLQGLTWSGLVPSLTLSLLLSHRSSRVSGTQVRHIPTAGLCIYCFHHQECSSPRYKQGSLPHLLQLFTQTWCSHWGLPNYLYLKLQLSCTFRNFFFCGSS